MRGMCRSLSESAFGTKRTLVSVSRMSAFGGKADMNPISPGAVKEAREIGQAATLMYALLVASITHVICGNYAEANAIIDELVTLTDQTGSSFWGAWGMMQRGCVLALT